MKVHQLMNGCVLTCGPQDSLERAAQLLWEHDCGVLPVVDDKDCVRGVITDRDICMGAYTRGQRLSDLTVSDSMSPTVVSCHLDEDVTVVARRMAEHRVRRLLVVDDKGRIQGIVSLNDLARAGARNKDVARAASRVLETVSRPRRPAEARAPTQDAAPRTARRPSTTARATVLLASKTDEEC
jgi:CBS domain-containing protein